MTRFAAFSIAAAVLASPAFAATYSAKPVVTPAAKRIVGRDIAWVCGPVVCRGATESSRPLLLCQDLAKRAGRLSSFVADGHALGATELAKCNAAAKGGAPAALATAN